MSESIQSLIERVEKCAGPDREIDVLLFAIDRPDFYAQCSRNWEDFLPIKPSDVPSIRTREAYIEAHAEMYTASIDAALALVERKLIDPHFSLSGPAKYLNIPSPLPNYWWAEIIHGKLAPYIGKRGWGATAPLALLAALLRALESPNA